MPKEIITKPIADYLAQEDKEFIAYFQKTFRSMKYSLLLSNVASITGLPFIISKLVGNQYLSSAFIWRVINQLKYWTGNQIDFKDVNSNLEKIFTTLLSDLETLNPKHSTIDYRIRLREVFGTVFDFLGQLENAGHPAEAKAILGMLNRYVSRMSKIISKQDKGNELGKMITSMHGSIHRVTLELFLRSNDLVSVLPQLFSIKEALGNINQFKPSFNFFLRAVTSAIYEELGQVDKAQEAIEDALDLLRTKGEEKVGGISVLFSFAIYKIVDRNIKAEKYFEANNFINKVLTIAPREASSLEYFKVLATQECNKRINETLEKFKSDNYKLEIVGNEIIIKFNEVSKIRIRDYSKKIENTYYFKLEEMSITNIENKLNTVVNNYASLKEKEKNKQADKANKAAETPSQKNTQSTNEERFIPLVIQGEKIKGTHTLKTKYSSSAAIKEKTRGEPSVQSNVTNNNANENTENEPSIFGPEFLAKDVHALKSKNKFIPEGVYYGIFSPPKESIYGAQKDAIYKKFRSVLQDATIVGSGNGIKWGKSDHTFKLAPLGDETGDGRMWSHVVSEKEVNGKKIFLLAFDEEHTHQTQKKKYKK